MKASDVLLVAREIMCDRVTALFQESFLSKSKLARGGKKLVVSLKTTTFGIFLAFYYSDEKIVTRLLRWCDTIYTAVDFIDVRLVIFAVK